MPAPPNSSRGPCTRRCPPPCQTCRHSPHPPSPSSPSLNHPSPSSPPRRRPPPPPSPPPSLPTRPATPRSRAPSPLRPRSVPSFPLHPTLLRLLVISHKVSVPRCCHDCDGFVFAAVCGCFVSMLHGCFSLLTVDVHAGNKLAFFS